PGEAPEVRGLQPRVGAASRRLPRREIPFQRPPGRPGLLHAPRHGARGAVLPTRLRLEPPALHLVERQRIRERLRRLPPVPGTGEDVPRQLQHADPRGGPTTVSPGCQRRRGLPTLWGRSASTNVETKINVLRTTSAEDLSRMGLANPQSRARGWLAEEGWPSWSRLREPRRDLARQHSTRGEVP